MPIVSRISSKVSLRLKFKCFGGISQQQSIKISFTYGHIPEKPAIKKARGYTLAYHISFTELKRLNVFILISSLKIPTPNFNLTCTATVAFESIKRDMLITRIKGIAYLQNLGIFGLRQRGWSFLCSSFFSSLDSLLLI